MGVEKTTENTSARLNKSNSVDIYVPPALRRSVDYGYQHENKATSQSTSLKPDPPHNLTNGDKVDVQAVNATTVTRVRRERRPDRAVYIPRARRSLTTSPQVNSTPEQISSANITLSSKQTNEKQLINNQKRRPKTVGFEKDSGNSSGENFTVIENCDTETETKNDIQSQNSSVCNVLRKPDFKSDNNCDRVNKDIVDSMNSTNTESNNISNLLSNMNDTKPQNTALRIEDALDSVKNTKGDHEVEELLRASKEINRSNRRIMKQTFNSNVLEIPDRIIVKELTNKREELTKDRKKKDIDPETDDWDSIFDDNGECVDPKILEELSVSVGKVKIETPKADYTAYHIKQSILNEEEFPHVLEVSNFPVEFKTQDLMMIFSMYKESGFDIKWVDDTHALAVFSSSRIAAEVLAMGHPFVVLKPLAEATIESRAKAKKCSSSLQPYRPRPETCAALARRLVTGALGVRLKTAAQERENEKRVLKEAKERKLLAAKQRDEAWES